MASRSVFCHTSHWDALLHLNQNKYRSIWDNMSVYMEGVCGHVHSCRTMRLSDLQTFSNSTSRGQEVCRLMLHRGQGASDDLDKQWQSPHAERQIQGECVWGGIRDGKDSSLPLCLSTDNPCRLGVAQIHEGSIGTTETWRWSSSGADSSLLLTSEDVDKSEKICLPVFNHDL